MSQELMPLQLIVACLVAAFFSAKCAVLEIKLHIAMKEIRQKEREIEELSK